MYEQELKQRSMGMQKGVRFAFRLKFIVCSKYTSSARFNYT